MFVVSSRPRRGYSVARCGAAAAAVCLAASLAAEIRPARAADASDWTGDARSAVRVVAGAARNQNGTKIHRAGIEIRLAPGWKTYWRYPGDSGVPPRFDFAGSGNVKSVTVLWPAPQRLVDSEGVTIGYKTGVIFPLHVEASDPTKPVALRLKLDYGICEKLCIPVDAGAALDLTGADSPHEAALAAAEARVPKAAAMGGAGDVVIASVRQDTTSSPSRILVDVKADAPVELFAEGPTPHWALPVPEPIAGALPGSQRFAFALDGLPPGASAQGAVLKLTASAGGRAIETSYRLD
jgi:DsbC/DsbD-like thiol-disulfide interchange protein